VSDEKAKYVTVHVKLRRDLYEKLWRKTMERFTVPTKKFHVVLNEVIEDYFNKLEAQEQQR